MHQGRGRFKATANKLPVSMDKNRLSVSIFHGYNSIGRKRAFQALPTVNSERPNYLYTLWHMTDKLGIEADAEAFSYIGDSRHDKIALHEKELARDQQIAEVKKVAAKINEELGNAKMTALYVTLNKIEKLPNQYHQIILKEIYDDERFFSLLKESNKYEEWGLMKDILKELLVPPDKWFQIGCKSDIVN